MLATEQAVFQVPAGEGETILVMTDLCTIKARQPAGPGAFALSEVTTPPGGGPPGLHRHPDQETFYVLEGRYRFDTMQGGQRVSLEAGRGAVIHIPSRVWHNYQNIGTEPGKQLVLLQPGDLIEFFRELGLAVTDRNNLPRPAGPPDLARLMAITEKHHVEMLSKPGTKGD